MATLAIKTASPYLTWHQLKVKYPNSWVLLVNPNVPPTGYKVVGGEFVFAHKNQENVFGAAQHLPKGSVMKIIYTGNLDLPDNVALCL